MRTTTILFLLSLFIAACDPCADYCALECECSAGGDGCEETCLTTLDVYTGPERGDECAERQSALEETCR
jgi:hypothetical protein